MAVAAPKRRTAPAPPPSRTKPPKRKASKPKGTVVIPAPRKAPVRAPRRAKPKVRRNPGARVIPLAGRTAVAVSQLPDSSLIVRMTRGRLWIGVLGALLVGIVALNVVNLSFTANAARIDAQIAALESENGVLEARQATRYSVDRLRSAGRQAGLVQPPVDQVHFVEFDRDTLAEAAGRLAAASP